MRVLSTRQKGFTLVEVLIVVVLITIIVSMVISGFRDYARFQQYNQAVSDVLFVLNQSKLSARSAEGDVSHGVHFTTNSITQFTGTAYSAADPTNKTTTYNLVTIEHTLSDSGDDIIFTKLTGLPSATGTVVVTGVEYDASTTIEVTASGVIQ